MKLKEQSKSQGTLVRSNLYSDAKNSLTGKNLALLKNYSDCYSNEPNYFERVQSRMI
jgi:hypothetical protein